MKKALACAGLLLAGGALFLPAQEYVGGQDFLTQHEADLIREDQEPNERIQQYLQFASLRLELIKQQLAVEKPGRSAQIHRNLEEFGEIMDTIDTVIEDALLRKLTLDQGIEALTAQGEAFLAELEKIADDSPDDHWAYQFVLADAIDITRDTMEYAQGDLKARARSLMEAEAREEKKRVESMAPQMREEVLKAKEAQERKEAERERKRPTLLKPGEKKDK